MNLTETLVYTDIQHLNRIAHQYQIPVNSCSKNELIQMILQEVLSQRELRNQLQKLTEIEWRFLILLLIENRNGLTYEDLLAKASYILRTENNVDPALTNRVLIQNMINRGWLFQDKRNRGFMYRVPVDLRRKLITGVRTQIQHSRTNTFTQSPNTLYEGPNYFVQDLIHFLNFVKNEMVLLTSDGVIHKRLQLQLLKILHIQEKIIDSKEWRFGYGRRFNCYPNRFSLIYDYSYSNELIYEDESLLRITEKGKEILENQTKISIDQAFIYWIHLYQKPIKNLTYLIYFIGLVSEQWMEESQILAFLEKDVQSFYYDSKEEVLSKRVIQLLTWFNWLEVQEVSGNSFYKTTKWAEQWLAFHI